MSWTVYSDGGCHGNPGPAGFGAVVVPPNGVTVEASGFIGHATNQVAELTAALEGLKLTPEGAEVLLISDSQYTLKGLTEWRAGWERKGMRTAAGAPVANAGLWLELWQACDARHVKTRWVKGHSGDKHNERCDVLAGAAIRSRGAAVAAPTASALAPAPVVSAPSVAASSTWKVLASSGAGVEPEGTLILYGLLQGGKVVRAESGVRSGVIRGCLWATHWMRLPT